MTFWHMQIHPDNASWGKERDVLNSRGPNLGLIGLGDWDKGETAIQYFCVEMQIGDIVAIRTGAQPVALVMVSSDYQEGPGVVPLWFAFSREVRVLDWYKPELGYLLPPRKTLLPCRNEERESAKIIKGWYEKAMAKQEMMKLSALLRGKKQLILQGAPGVGKTYATKELALHALEIPIPSDRASLNAAYTEEVKNGHIIFVTFHQSMDYEDFVEGYKPAEGPDGQPTFELRDGPFKNIVNSCLGTNWDADFEASWVQFLDEIEANPGLQIPYPVKTGKFPVWPLNETTLEVSPVGNPDRRFKVTKRKIRACILDEMGYRTYVVGIARYMKIKYVSLAASERLDRKPHVLIIDEINRGNVSKIFGELITLLETDKRDTDIPGYGETLSVKLTYSQEDFKVPHNLFIIGTMNTADRSLGQIDYALRRRFAFHTIQSNESALESYYKVFPRGPAEDAIAKFNSIRNFFMGDGATQKSLVHSDLDPEDVMVGHSYFMAETKEELDTKLKYEVLPLLEEYRKDGILMCSKDTEAYRRLREVLGASI